MLQSGSVVHDDKIFLCAQHNKPIVYIKSDERQLGQNVFNCIDCWANDSNDEKWKYKNENQVRVHLKIKQSELNKIYSKSSHVKKFVAIKTLITDFMNQIEKQMISLDEESIGLEQYDKILNTQQFTRKVWLEAGILLKETYEKEEIFRKYFEEIHENLRQIKYTIDQLFERQDHYQSPNTKQVNPSDQYDIEPYWNNVTQMSQIYTLPQSSKPKAAFSADRQLVAIVMKDETIQIRDVNSYSLVSTLIGHRKQIRALTFSNDNEYLISSSQDQTTRIWNIRTQQGVIFLSKQIVEQVCYIPNQKQFITQIDHDQLIMWDAQNDMAPIKSMVLLPNFIPYKNLSYSSDAKLLLQSFWCGYRLINPRNWSPLKTVKMIYSDDCYFSLNNKFVFVFGMPARMNVWNIKPHRLVCKLRIINDFDFKFSQSSNQSYIATTRELINISTRKSTNLPIFAMNISFSKDGNSLIVVSDYSIQTFDTSLKG